MLRQRMRSRSFPLARVAADVLVVVFALGLVWGGAMLVLLALKVSPSTVDGLSGYRAAYDHLGGLGAEDITASTRLIAAIGGVIACLIFGYMAWRSLPRPYLARTRVRLISDARGTVDVHARAIERAAEIAALDHPALTGARARFAAGEDLTLDVSAGRADLIATTLEDVHRLAGESLARHDLPVPRVNVTLVRFERENRRELQ